MRTPWASASTYLPLLWRSNLLCQGSGMFCSRSCMTCIVLSGAENGCLLCPLQVQGSWCSRSGCFQWHTLWSARNLGRGFCEAREKAWREAAAAEGVCRQKGPSCSGGRPHIQSCHRDVPDFGAHPCRRMQRRHWRTRRIYLQLRSRLQLCNHHQQLQQEGSRPNRALSRCEGCMRAQPAALSRCLRPACKGRMSRTAGLRL